MEPDISGIDYWARAGVDNKTICSRDRVVNVYRVDLKRSYLELSTRTEGLYLSLYQPATVSPLGRPEYKIQHLLLDIPWSTVLECLQDCLACRAQVERNVSM